MIKTYLVNSILILLTTVIAAQVPVKADSDLEDKKDRNYIINLDFLSASFQYEKKVNAKYFAGTEILGGMGYRRIIGRSLKEIDDESGELYGGHISEVYESVKLKIYFSNYFSRYLYQNFGVYGSMITSGEGNFYFASGIEYSIFFGARRFRFGPRFQIGVAFLKFDKYHEANFNALYGSITPIVLQFRF